MSRRSLLRSSLFLALLILVGGLTFPTGAQDHARNIPRGEILLALQDIIEIRQTQFERMKVRHQDGRVNQADLGDAECRLLEAEIRLAVVKKQPNDAIMSADHIHQIRQEQLDSLRQSPERVNPDQLAQAMIEEAEARIRQSELRYRFAVLRNGPR